MPSRFWISVTFLTNRYHGTEWPPSPARLIQALVAAANTGANREIWLQAKRGLEWLEARPAPTILARAARELQKYRIAVPNNDFDWVAKAWAGGRSANPADIRTMKDVQPRLVEGQGPHVRYLWELQDSENGQDIAEFLTPAAHRLYSLGWGVDMAYADSGLTDTLSDLGWDEWSPASTGQQLVVPVKGFLNDLESTYRQFTARVTGAVVDTDTRPSVYGLQRYSKRKETSAPWVAFSLRKLNGEDVFKIPCDRTIEVAAWMRHAAGLSLKEEEIGENIDAFVLGHPDDPAAANHRLSFVPLPSIHPQHGDGWIRRIMVAEPITGNGRAAASLASKWIGAALRDINQRERCFIEEPDERVIPLYTCRSRDWRTVTPVVLHGYNSARGVVSIAKTEGLLLRAFEMAGRGREQIESLAFQASPLWSGTTAAASIRVPKHLSGYPRYHVQVKFREPAKGPVLAGIGRHFGLGVFAAAN